MIPLAKGVYQPVQPDWTRFQTWYCDNVTKNVEFIDACLAYHYKDVVTKVPLNVADIIRRYYIPIGITPIVQPTNQFIQKSYLTGVFNLNFINKVAKSTKYDFKLPTINNTKWAKSLYV